VALLSRIEHSAVVVAEVLAAVGLVEDDRVPRSSAGSRSRSLTCPRSMRAELTVWFQVSRAGSAISPRIRPRSDIVVVNHLRWGLSVLRTGAACHKSWREIGRDHALAALPPTGANARRR
jgi:hypothetical protein